MLFYKGSNMLTPYLVMIVLILTMDQIQARLFELPSSRPEEPCILLNINFTIHLKAFRGSQEVASVQKTSDDDGIVINGSCSDDINSILSLRFNNRVTWTLRFHQVSGNVELNRLIQFVPVYAFGSSVPDLSLVTMEDPGFTDLGSSAGSYNCSVPETINYGNPFSTGATDFNYTVVEDVSQFQAQAFNVKDGQFSHATNCGDTSDTTTQATTTTTPTSDITTPDLENTTTPIPATPNTTTRSESTTVTKAMTTLSPWPYINKFVVKDDNVTCIVVQGMFSIVINYKANTTSGSEIRSVTVEIPAEATSEGNCNPSSSIQTLTISFNNGWLLELTFTTDDEVEETESLELKQTIYHISNVTLTYTVNDQTFRDSAIPPGTVVTVIPNAEELDYPKKSKNAGFYKCLNEVILKITDDVKILTKDLEFMAFNQNNNATFRGGVDECAADRDTDNTASIVVGCVFAGLAVVVAAIYAFTRYRKNRKMRKYESI